MTCSRCKQPAAPDRKMCAPHLEAARTAQRNYLQRKGPEWLREKNLRAAYGITVEEYERLLDAQAGKCAICGAKDTYHHKGRSGRLAVDHDHETGRVRGLLCSHCNRGVGMLKDDADLLERAAQYLRGGLV